MGMLNLEAPRRTTGSDLAADALEDARERYHRDYDAPFEAMARQRGELANRQNAIRARLREISPTVGADGLICDPADSDGALRAERVKLRDELNEINSSIAEIDGKRRELESRAAGERERLDKLEYDADQANVMACMGELAAAVVAMDSAIAEALDEIESMQHKYAAHRHLAGGITLRAHAGAPPLVALLSTVKSAIKLLTDNLAEWRSDILPPDHPSRKRAERVELANQRLSDASVAAQKRQAEAARERAAQRGLSSPPPPAPPRPRDMLDCYALVEAGRAKQ